MAQCAAKTKDGTPCKNLAQGQKYCHIHRRQRIWRRVLSASVIGTAILGLLSFIANVAGILGFFGINPPSFLRPQPTTTYTSSFTPTASHTPSPTSTFLDLNTVIVEKPILSSPGNGISMPQKTDITLVWNPSKNAVQYEVEAWGGPYTMMTPCIWQDATLCHIGQWAPGTISWRVKARNDKGQASEWSDTWSFKIEPIPGYVELIDDLQLTTPAGNWPPNKEDKLIAHIHIRNGGDQPLQIVHIGVKGRRNGNEFWDIGFWSITLNGNEPWSLDPNNERPLESGEYSFQLTYSLDGTTWELLGSEYKFTVP